MVIPPSALRITAPAPMASTPKATRRSKFSWNTNHASNTENTPSKFRSSDALDAAVSLRPYIMSTGATTPPAKMAAASQQRSAVRNGATTLSEPRAKRRTKLIAQRPIPDPKYSNPANIQGSTSRMSRFASGVLAPNSTPADKALAAPKPTFMPPAYPRPRHDHASPAPAKMPGCAIDLPLVCPQHWRFRQASRKRCDESHSERRAAQGR
jgi:hypothetical protein